MAERVGFEPTAPCGVTGFQDQLLKPLGHLSKLNYYLNILPCFDQQIKPLTQLSPEKLRKSLYLTYYIRLIPPDFIKLSFVLTRPLRYNEHSVSRNNLRD